MVVVDGAFGFKDVFLSQLPGLFLAEGTQWRNQRRMVMAGLAPGAIKAYFPALVTVAQRLQRRSGVRPAFSCRARRLHCSEHLSPSTETPTACASLTTSSVKATFSS